MLLLSNTFVVGGLFTGKGYTRQERTQSMVGRRYDTERSQIRRFVWHASGPG